MARPRPASSGTPGDLPFLCNNDFSYGGNGVTLAPSYHQGAWSWYLNDAAADVWEGTGRDAPLQNTLNNGAWHHLVYTFDRTGNATVYQDGVLEDQRSIATAAGWNLDTGMAFDVGQAGGTYGENGVFDMDDLGIWRRALSRTEAQSICIVGQNSGQSFDVYGPVSLVAQKSGADLELIWQAGTLEVADEVSGTYLPVSNATPPYYRVTPGPRKKFYRARL